MKLSIHSLTKNNYVFTIDKPLVKTNNRKKQIKITLYNPSSVSLTINQRYAEAGKIFPLATREGEEVFELDEGAPYLEVLISRATSLPELEQFLKIFSHLMAYIIESPDAKLVKEEYEKNNPRYLCH